MRKQRRNLFWPVAGALALFVLGLSIGRTGRSTQVTEVPVVLEQVRALGNLHLVEHRYHTVIDVDSHRDPAEWTQRLPGVRTVATQVVKSATKNNGVATVSGTVEAGIEMSRARIEKAGNQTLVVLPEPEIYEPNVQAIINHQRSAIAWNDRNLGFRAEQRGAKQFLEASRKAGILEQARENGSRQVREIFTKAGLTNVEVRFERDLT